MSTYIYKSISNLDDAATISDDDILLISQQINNQLISKKITVNDVINYIYPKVEDYVNESINGYLPLTAGVNNAVQGEIYTTAHNAMSQHSLNMPLILNGNSSKQKCGKIKLHSSESINEHTLTGEFELEVNSHNTTYSLKGYNTGSLKWNDKNIVRSVNNNEALDSGDITLLSVESTNKLNNPITITLSGDLSGSVSFDGSSNIDLSAYITKTIKDKILSSDIEGQLSVSQIDGLKDLAFKDKILSSDIEGQLSVSQIDGLKDLAFKDKILSSDIEGQLSTSQIAGLKTELDSKISSVIVTPNLTAGTEIATIDVNGESKTLYAPEGSVVRGGVANVGIGSIIAFAGENIPDNTLLCDGREISKTDYEALYLIIGDKYGEASDSSKFKLPNLTERFIEGISSDLSVGTYMEAGLPNIEGNINASGGNASGALDYTGSKVIGHGSSYSYGNATFNASRSNEIYGKSNTVQPPAILMKYVIVYKQLEGGNVIINTEGGSGGVIDGTICKDTDGVECVTLVTASEWAEKQQDDGKYVYEYIVKNDCLLNIEYHNDVTTTSNESTRIYINEVLIRVSTDTMDSYSGHIDLPIKAGTAVKFVSELEPSLNFNDVDADKVELPCAIKLIEFKLNVLNPQLAFPDYNKEIDLSNNLIEQIEYTYNVTCNGWIAVSGKGCAGDSYIKINDKTLFLGNTESSSYDMAYEGFYPVSKNDIVKYKPYHIPAIFKFYPVKSVSQEVPSNCASYVIESGRFNSSDGTTHSDNSENDSWYRLYSDGWCEQGGLKIDNANAFNQQLDIKLNKKLNDGYTVIISNASQTAHYVRYTYNYTSDGFSIKSDGADSVSCNQCWEAKGFIN